MKLENAIKKLKKNGYKVTSNDSRHTALKGQQVIEFASQDGRVLYVRSRGVNDKDDIMTDYSAGVFYDNITQAIR